VFAPENPIGINPLIILIAIVFWWGILQSVIGLYFANRVLGERQWDHKKMGKLGWGFSLFFSLQAVQTFMKLNGSSISGYAISLCILLVLALVLVFSKKPGKMIFFQRRRFLDFLVTLQVVLSLSIGLTVGSRTNQVTQIAFIIWSVLVGISISIYRWRNGTTVPV
jgi:hypothetical protein